jgi:leader peptidase (prepilin peptidase) / N-methyltransferase
VNFLFENPSLLIFMVSFSLVIGSFLNVCISRWPLELSVVAPRSRCPSCETPIPWFHNIPIVSYLVLQGRCRKCKTRIPIRYLIVEILTPILFFLAIWSFPAPVSWPFSFYLMASLVVATFVDLEHWIIPDKITLPGIAVGLIGSFLVPYNDPVSSLAGIFLGGGILFAIGYIYLRWKNIEGIGGGDIKFLAMAGAFLGPRQVLVALVLASFLGSLIGAIIILRQRGGAKTAVQFGPFLALGVLIAFLWGDAIASWYLGFPILGPASS